jgi:hypothetical protein
MCVDCVLSSPRIAQADPGQWTPSRGGSIITSLPYLESDLDDSE